MVSAHDDQFYRSVYEYSLDAVFFTAPDGTIFAANPAACRLFLRTEEEICRAGREGLVDMQSPRLKELIEERARTGKTRGELIFIRGDGSRFPGEISSAVFKNAKGEDRTALIVRDLSVAKQSEQLREDLLAKITREAAEMESILAAQEDIILLYDPDMNVRRANPSFRVIYGFDPVGINVREMIRRVSCRYPDGRPLVLDEQPTPRALRGEEVRNMVYAVTKADGSTAMIEASSRPLLIRGEISGTVTVWHDITEIKEAEEALKKYSAEIEDLYNLAPCGYHSLDKDGFIVRINETELSWLGYPREEVLGKMKWQDLITPESLKTFQTNFPVFLKQGFINDLEFEIIRKNGRVFSGLINAVAIYDSNGHYLMSRSTVFDITERKQAEIRLKLAASVFTHVREGIMITDAHGTIIDVNETFTLITGYSKEEVVGQNPRMLQSGRQEEEFYRQMWRDLDENGHWSGEAWNRRKSGEVYAEMLTISAVRDASGKVRNYVGLFTDITLVKEHQKQLEHMANFDSLTGLPNRFLLADRLQQAMNQSLRRGKSLAVAFIDLDGFKEVNDRYGHDSGDELLIAISHRMKEALREEDSLARIGGDEFVAVLADLENPMDCEPVLSRLLRATSEKIKVKEALLQVSASIGVTLYPRDEGNAEQLVRHADRAMYSAKQSGKNRYHLFEAE